MFNKIEKKLNNKLIAFGIIFGLTFLIYINSISAPFVLDDFSSITDNFSIRNPLNFAAIWHFYSNRFIIYLTFSLNFFIHQSQVEGYHVVNILIHMINGMLVYLILFSILGLSYFKNKTPGRYRNIISLLAALAFISHPVQVNAVTYVVQRTAALATTFYFLAILMFIKYRLHNKIRYFLITMLAIVLAMYTKENTVTIPFMLLFIDILFFWKDIKTTWLNRIASLFIIFLTLPVIPGTNLFLGGHSLSDPTLQFKASTSMNNFTYFYTELNVIVRYIKLLFIPDNLNFDYSNDIALSTNIFQHGSFISFIILSVIFLVGILSFKRNKLLCFGILWFFIGLSVESSFISIKDVYFEHRLYFPLAGFIFALIGLIFMDFRGFWRRLSGRSAMFKKPLAFFIIFMVIFIIFTSAVTVRRNYIFDSNIRLWSDVVKKAPGSDRAHSSLGGAYLNAYSGDETDTEFLKKAETELTKAIELNNNNSTARCNLARVYYYEKEYYKCISMAISSNDISRSEYAFYNEGLAYEKLDKKDKALEAFLEAYKIDNKATFILEKLANLYYDKKDYENAKTYYSQFFKYYVYDYNDTVREMKKKYESIK